MMAVPVKTGSAFGNDAPHLLFEAAFGAWVGGHAKNYGYAVIQALTESGDCAGHFDDLPLGSQVPEKCTLTSD